MAVCGAAVLSVWVCGCTVTSPTGQELAASLTTTFGNLWVRQQALLGRPGAFVADADPVATCTTGYSTGPASGPVDDWRCVVLFQQQGRAVRAEYDVRVRPTGCYTADGPLGVVGPPRLPRPSGPSVLNPLAGFDGCLDLA